MWFVQVPLILILLLIFVQDIRSRSVYWILFPLIIVLFACLRLNNGFKLGVYFLDVSLNIGFVLFQLLFVSFYFSIKARKWVILTESLLGWGDILFLLSIAFYFSTLNYLLVYIGSLIFSLMMWITIQAFTPKKNKKIPLAGLQAFLITLILAMDWWLLRIDLTKNDWLQNLFYRWM